MRCLCCNKIISENASVDEIKWGWHKKCVRKFFGTATLPQIDLSETVLNEIVTRSISQGLTIPGVQKKMSLHLTPGKNARLTLVNYPTGYILKPQTDEYPYLPEYEHTAMLMAEAVHIRTVPHALIGVNGTYAYITRRVDRVIRKDSLQMFAMEDFCQLSMRLTRDKYRGSYENCGKIIRKYSSVVGFDLSEMYLRILFSFLIGNSDMHLKNFSLREDKPGSRIFHLSEAYDMLPVNLILPSDKDQMALTIHGKKRHIRKNDFLNLAENCGIPIEAAKKMILELLNMKQQLISIVQESFLPAEKQLEMEKLMNERAMILR
jgi:serine/threonine-protein kinase HipA